MLTPDIRKQLRTRAVSLDTLDDHLVPYFVAELAADAKGPVLLMARDHNQHARWLEAIRFLAPGVEVADFPSWDVQPYDRLSADREIQAHRLRTAALLRGGRLPLVVVTTVAALSTKLPPPDAVDQEDKATHLMFQKGSRVDREDLLNTLVAGGYSRVSTVMEPGEFAVRGSLIDIYPASAESPYRLDLFDDEVESIKTFDPVSQRSEGEVPELVLHAASEVVLTEGAISTFRKNYRSLFPEGMDDAIYTEISAGRQHAGAGHYLPLFFQKPLVTLFAFLPADAVILASPTFPAARAAFIDQVADAYTARLKPLKTQDEGEDTYRPLPPETLYLNEDAWQQAMGKFTWLYRAAEPGADVALAARPHMPYTAARQAEQSTTEALAADIRAALKAKKTVVLSCFSQSSLDRTQRLLEEHDLMTFAQQQTWAEATARPGIINMMVSPLLWGMDDPAQNLFLLTEQDMFGEKQNPVARRKRKSDEQFIASLGELSVGDYVVHIEHGIGRFTGLQTLTAGGFTHDFITLEYDGGDKLYVPVVALDVLSRYAGAEAAPARLDKLGGAAWQARKAKVKQKLLDMAADLLKVAAARQLHHRPRYTQPSGMYDEFNAGFPYTPTSEQQAAIQDVEADLYTDTPMDRLVVGDVGFGKTEVALRAAFIAAADGRQVAVVAPTTLLVRQHEAVFKKRFAHFPLSVAGLSRLTLPKRATEIKAQLAKGQVDIVIGTHALLSKSIAFKNLGLMIIDEEQRFGVTHKERLKQLRSTVDVLTLTATPIPRTMQMALTGIKTLSTITTPPVDRLAVRSFVMGFDSKVLREALLREIFRGGQAYVVTPKVEGITKLANTIRELVPEAQVRVAHGQMDRDALDEVMTDFYEGKFNVLVSTTIVESGLDVPTANTLIVHRADSFGLAQLYQLRGRVGRGKTRAYAYFLTPSGGRMTEDAYKRLQILKRLEGLGAGFTLASYDLDIRGPGNLLGSEQSGHIREVGFELYNHMLREAIEELQSGSEVALEEVFTPILNLGLSYRIPEEYVPDLNTRMSLYRRLSNLREAVEVEEFRDEMADRFGPMPGDVEALLAVVGVRNRCRILNIEKIDVGEKAVLIAFHRDRFANPEGLLHYILKNPGVMGLRPDQKVTLHRRWPDAKTRMRGLESLLADLEKLLPVDASASKVAS